MTSLLRKKTSALLFFLESGVIQFNLCSKTSNNQSLRLPYVIRYRTDRRKWRSTRSYKFRTLRIILISQSNKIQALYSKPKEDLYFKSIRLSISRKKILLCDFYLSQIRASFTFDSIELQKKSTNLTATDHPYL
jgi:hypothetical protein